MKSCGFGPQASPYEDPPDQPWPHRFNVNKPTPIIPDKYADNAFTLGPAGTFYCSMNDWAKFAQLHIDGFNKLSTIVLKPESFVKLHTKFPGQDYTYGGWQLVERPWGGGPVLTHRGSNNHNATELWIAPLKNVALLAATNIAGDAAWRAIDQAYGPVYFMDA